MHSEFAFQFPSVSFQIFQIFLHSCANELLPLQHCVRCPQKRVGKSERKAKLNTSRSDKGRAKLYSFALWKGNDSSSKNVDISGCGTVNNAALLLTK